MPYLPGGENASILANFGASTILAWVDGADIPKKGPHTQVNQQYGCTINRDFRVDSTRSNYVKGMTGIWLEEKGDNVKIHIPAVTEYWHRPAEFAEQIWVENCWIPKRYVNKCQPWRSDINNWNFKMDLHEVGLNSSTSSLNPTGPDDTVLGKTIAALLAEFQENPAPFMGNRIQSAIDKRATLIRGFDSNSLVISSPRASKMQVSTTYSIGATSQFGTSPMPLHYM